MPAKKAKTVFVCQQCGYQSARWAGQCPDCKEWNSLVEQALETRRAATTFDDAATRQRVKPQSIRDVNVNAYQRMRVPLKEFNNVLGGGIVPGSVNLIGGAPGIGKCLVGSTRVLDPSSGAWLPITEWANESRLVLSLDNETHRLSTQPVAAFHDQGVQPIVEVTTRLGRVLRCTPSHPVLTPKGWQSIGDLPLGARIAAPRTLPYFGNKAMAEHELKLVAYLLTDGSTNTSTDVTNALPEVERDLTEIAEAFDVQLSVYAKPHNRAKTFRFVQPLGQRAEARQAIVSALKQVKTEAGMTWTEWAKKASVSNSMLNVWRRGECAPSKEELQRLAAAAGVSIETLAADAREQADMQTSVARFSEAVGLRFATAATKFVPNCIFCLPRSQLALFLKVLFSCDGSVYINKHAQAGISYSTISHHLAQDVQHLLLRFGFITKLRTKFSQFNEQPYTAYELQLLGAMEVKRFLVEIGIYGRTDAQAQIQRLPVPTLPSTQSDTIPTGSHFWTQLRELTAGVSFRTVSKSIGVTIHEPRYDPARYDRPLCRSTMVALAETYPSPYLQRLAYSDVYWDEIQSITPAGEERVYDLSIPSHANFVANDLIVHNSTLLLQISALMAGAIGPVLYVSAEESTQQIKMRAERIGTIAPDLYLLSETNLDTVIQEIADLKPKAVIIDSIQTVYLEELTSAAGSVSQVRECASRLQQIAKRNAMPIFLVGHVTKAGSIAGPRVLEHIVDVVLYLEGDRFHTFRLLRSVKNRFGATNEVGVFAMEAGGMIEVTNPSEAFLADRHEQFAGTTIAVTMEGTRPLLVELQALTSTTSFAFPRRTGNGVDMNRLLLMIAVLSKRVGLNLSNQDVFVNVVGGMKVSEPAADLSLAVAIASSYRDRVVFPEIAIVGEVGLSGELRSVNHADRRLSEAAKLGYKRCLIPHSMLKRVEAPKGLELVGARNVGEALEAALQR